MRIVVIGDVTTDVVALLKAPLAFGSDTPGTVRTLPGGQGANTAAWLAWLGRQVALVGAVGDDDAGQARVRELTAAGVRCVVRRCPGVPTGTVLVLSHRHERTMVSQRGANLHLDGHDITEALAAATDARHLHLSAYPLLDEASRTAGLRALAEARRRGMTISVDAASAEPLRQVGPDRFLEWVADVDILLANADEATVLTGKANPHEAALHLARVVRNPVVKLGRDGAIWCEGGTGIYRVEAPTAPVADSTGAGDAFAAGLVAAWVDGSAPAAALRRGCELGSLCVTLVGGRPGPAPQRAGNAPESLSR
ncbi:carbohydrate kinase family protein [Micromonospora sp. RP3T]|uniref:carbohydrate kinase family protein n=1 Tax=Micromonospora sp. RP3T TaxID=2135446 RepID=UPI001E59F1FE|nr:sugar kinase [Micromonospora sp. RP3T]